MSKEKAFKIFRENFAYYDRTGIQEFLEQKASEGWRLVKKQFATEWQFKRIEPQKLHYAITYLPQYSNEDSFLLSENKNEYLELCAASGWQFVCAYKNMVIFLNEDESPLPFETDPETEIATIHKSILKHNLPGTVISFVIFAISFIYMLFPYTATKNIDLALCVCAVITFYIVIDFFGYLRWRKKALAAAAAGEFSRTDIPDKLVSGLFIAFAVLCLGIIVVKSILMNSWGTLLIMAVIAVCLVFYDILEKLKKKTESKWKKRLIGFCHTLIFCAAIFLSNYITELF